MEWIVLFIHLPILISFIKIYIKRQNLVLSSHLTDAYIFKLIFFNIQYAVSIVIPSFNRVSFLNRSLTVCQAQTLKNIEIICVDDCSTDLTQSLVIERMKKDCRIKLVQNLYNHGVILSRFNGVFSSNGTYILTLDSDDLIYTNTSENAYKFSIQHNADVIDYIAGNYQNNGALISNNWRKCRGNYYDNSAIKNAFIKRYIDINLWKKFIKKSIFINAIKFIYPYVKDKKICLAEDDIIVASVLLFSSNFFCCTQFPAYIHFMGQDISVEAGKLQPISQNSLQIKYANNLTNYLYSKKNFHDCSPQEFFQNKLNLQLFNSLNTVTDKTIRANCDYAEKGFVHYDFNDKGYCVLIKTL